MFVRREAADVAGRRIVDVARRGRHEHERAESSGRRSAARTPTIGAHGMPDEHDVLERELVADVEDVLRVAVERAVAPGVVGRELRASVPDVVEQHDAVAIVERRVNVPPHVLVAPEAVGEHHRPDAATNDLDVVPFDDAHARTV